MRLWRRKSERKKRARAVLFYCCEQVMMSRDQVAAFGRQHYSTHHSYYLDNEEWTRMALELLQVSSH